MDRKVLRDFDAYWNTTILACGHLSGLAYGRARTQECPHQR